MSRKHFITIAAEIKVLVDAAGPEEKEILRRVAEGLCNTFRGLNPRFDRDRFLFACGVK